MPRVALMTIGIMHGPPGDPRVQGFLDRFAANYAAAESSPGFVARTLYDAEVEADTWGAYAHPAIFADEQYANRVPQTLSIWQNLESVFAFAYSGVHAEALSKRREWFVHGEWPSYVAWWIDDTAIPSWQEAHDRYEKLRRDGPSPNAFDFKHPFGSDGQPVTIDRSMVKRYASQQAVSQEQKPMPTPADIDTQVANYVAAWSEPDPAVRGQLLSIVWHESGTYTDRFTHAVGRAELDAVIAHFLADNPEALFSVTGKVDYHHSYLRFNWLLRLANGTELVGMDYGEVAPDNKLVKIVGFF